MPATQPRLCGACGAAAPPPFRAPPPELAPDLDLRPGEPTRSTLPRWIQICAGCGAAAPDLASLAPSAANGIGAVAGEPIYARPFLRWAAIAGADQPQALLQAAWSADDAGDPVNASRWRRASADSWGAPADTESALRLIDVLRRAGLHDRAAAESDRLAAAPLDDNSARILDYQRDRIEARDTGRHLISSALRPPARIPHVASVAARRSGGTRGSGKRGFWQRLLGS